MPHVSQQPQKTSHLWYAYSKFFKKCAIKLEYAQVSLARHANLKRSTALGKRQVSQHKINVNNIKINAFWEQFSRSFFIALYV